MLKKALKRWLWRIYDFLGHLILINLIWVLFALMAAALVVGSFRYSEQHASIWGFALTGILIFLLPTGHVFLFNLCGFAGRIRDTGVRGLGRLLLRSVLHGLPVFWICQGGLLIILVNLVFYRSWLGGNLWASSLATGLFLWVLLFWSMASCFALPLYVEGRSGIIKIFKQSILITLDNPLYSFGVMAAGAILVALGLFSIVGGLLILFSALSLWQMTATAVVLEKYSGDAKEEEPRRIRDLFNPWKG